MAKSLFIPIFFICANLFAQRSSIVWPANYEPAKSKFFVQNDIEIKASPATVWAVLIDANRWQSYYKGAKNVVLRDPSHQFLQGNSIFDWETMGLKFESTIREYIPNNYLAWESQKKSIQGYHVWLIVPTPNGCKLITEESQNGWLTFFEKTFQGKKLQKLHDVWLLEIKKQAESKQ